jgi:protein-S-isoprenylcysteine O-methyltransferase Ste14
MAVADRRHVVKLNIATLVVILIAAAGFAIYATNVAWTPWHIAGVAIAAPSLLLLVTARLQLGRAFSIEAKASALVTTGLYSKIRNPIYVFGALMLLGIIVFTGQPWFLLIFAALVPMQVLRSRREAQVLEEKFGAAYLEYKRSTWF